MVSLPQNPDHRKYRIPRTLEQCGTAHLLTHNEPKLDSPRRHWPPRNDVGGARLTEPCSRCEGRVLQTKTTLSAAMISSIGHNFAPG